MTTRAARSERLCRNLASLFTVIAGEDRYKAKSFIDTMVYRTGDQLGAWFTTLFRGLGLRTVELALIALPFTS